MNSSDKAGTALVACLTLVICTWLTLNSVDKWVEQYSATIPTSHGLVQCVADGKNLCPKGAECKGSEWIQGSVIYWTKPELCGKSEGGEE